MKRLKGEDVRRDITKLLPDSIDHECSGRIKVRIMDIDRLVNYVLSAYQLGVDDGKLLTKRFFKKIINKI